MAVTSRLDMCDQALAEIKAKAIASVEENSLEARECRRFYPKIISEMLEGPHDWSFQNRRVRLALLATNARESEWAFAYALPADMATSIRVIPDLTAAGLGLPTPLLGDPYAETWALAGRYFETPYIIEDEALYSNTESATLEYGINDISETRIGALVEKAIVKDLASRLAVPVKGDKDLKAALQAEAEVAWQRAIADDRNRQPQQSGEYISEGMLARGGLVA